MKGMVYMRKEELLSKKRGAISDLTWYVKDVMTEEDLRQFSPAQLKTLCDIMERAEKFRESTAPFVPFPPVQCSKKGTGRLPAFKNSEGIGEKRKKE